MASFADELLDVVPLASEQRADLAFFDESRQCWTIEPGTFRLHIGASSADIRAEYTMLN